MQCEYKATEKVSLKENVESKHQGVSLACDQCGYKAPRMGNLKRPVESSLEGACLIVTNVNIKQLKN